jgi:hypothetical protein
VHCRNGERRDREGDSFLPRLELKQPYPLVPQINSSCSVWRGQQGVQRGASIFIYTVVFLAIGLILSLL